MKCLHQKASGLQGGRKFRHSVPMPPRCFEHSAVNFHEFFYKTPPPQTAAMETMPRGACQQLHAQPKTFPFPSFPPRNRHSKIFEANIGEGGSLGQKKKEKKTKHVSKTSIHRDTQVKA